MHLPVLFFTTGLALVTGLVFGLVPAVAMTRGNTEAMLKDDRTRGTASSGNGLMRSTLVVAETALALVLLVGAGLLIRSFARLQEVKPGFSATTCSPRSCRCRRPATPIRRSECVLEPSGRPGRTLPGVTAVGLTSNVPFNGNVGSGSYSIVGYTPARARRSRTAGRRWSAPTTSGDADPAAAKAGCSTTAIPRPARRSW